MRLTDDWRNKRWMQVGWVFRPTTSAPTTEPKCRAGLWPTIRLIGKHENEPGQHQAGD